MHTATIATACHTCIKQLKLGSKLAFLIPDISSNLQLSPVGTHSSVATSRHVITRKNFRSGMGHGPITHFISIM